MVAPNSQGHEGPPRVPWPPRGAGSVCRAPGHSKSKSPRRQRRRS